MGRPKKDQQDKRIKTSIALNQKAYVDFRDTCHKLGLSASDTISKMMVRWTRRNEKCL